jgi:hypothetical protein
MLHLPHFLILFMLFYLNNVYLMYHVCIVMYSVVLNYVLIVVWLTCKFSNLYLTICQFCCNFVTCKL